MKLFKNVCLLMIVGSMCWSSCYEKFDPSSYAPPLSINGYTSSDEIAPANLVGYWPFDGNYNDAVTGSPAENVGTSIVNGFKGQAMKGALNAYVLVNPSADILSMQSFTITYWVNSPLNTNGIVGLVNLSNQSAFWGNIDMFFENGGTPSTTIFKAHIFNNNTTDAWLGNYTFNNVWDTWMAIAVSYDAATSTFKVFLNGSKVAESVQAGYGNLNFVNSGKMVFGTVHFQTNPSLTSATGSQPWASYLTGSLDEVRIYNTALPESDINSLVKLQGRGK